MKKLLRTRKNACIHARSFKDLFETFNAAKSPVLAMRWLAMLRFTALRIASTNTSFRNGFAKISSQPASKKASTSD